MNIAYLSSLYPFRGGISQSGERIIKSLEAQGHNLSPFTFTTQYPKILFPGKTQYFTDDNAENIIKAERILSSINPISWQKTVNAINNSSPDLVLMRYWMSFFAPSLGYVAGKLKKNTKVISIIDNLIPHEKRFFDTPLTRYFINRNDGFFVMSQKVKTDLLKLNPNAKIEYFPHPLYDNYGKIVDKNESRKKLNIDINKKTLLFFGIIRDYKGLDILIEAFDKLDESYQLLIAGEIYGDSSKYSKLINSNKNKKNIHTHFKFISDSEVSLYFSASDVCVLPYRDATQSGITAISYHFDVPVIATNVGGLSETIHHNKTGIIAEKAEANMIRDSIIDFYKNKDSINFIENIHEIKQQLSWDKFTEKLIEFSKSL